MLLFALAPLLVCIAGLAIAFYRWRNYPIFRDAINFKHPRWLVLFASLGIGTISFSISWGLNHSHLFKNIHPNQMPPMFDSNDVAIILFLALVAIVCSFLSAVWCLFRLISALLSHVHSLQSKQS
jgi:hypothetical protein